jgi:TRAP-type mannitol/chloroaromatic compound transport system substrate-binding protein
MPLPFPFNPNQTDAKSPIDEQLMDDNIRENIEYLETQVGGGGGGGGAIEFKINGDLSRLKLARGLERGRRLDGAFIAEAQTFTRAKLFLRKRGVDGSLEVDVRRAVKLNHIIESIASQFSDNTQSIARAGSAINTQSITKATPDVSTQSIAFTVSAVNISSIVRQQNSPEVRINVTGALLSSSNYVVGRKIRISGATSGANNGDFEILEINRDGDANIIVSNPSGVNQSGAAGTIQALIFSYNLTLPASSEFVVGEKANFSGHTASANDGQFVIHSINNGGNNVCVFNDTSGSTTQGAAAGTTGVLRWLYTYAAPVSTPDYTVGETVTFASHTSSANDGNFEILALNSGGNNIKIHNVNGVLQGGVAGNANTNRWIYSLNINPTSSFTAGQTMVAKSHTDSRNNGSFEVKEVNRSALNNLVIHNTSGQAQAGVAGTVNHSRHVLTFASDLSASYQTSSPPSIVDVINTADEENSGQFTVVEINRAGFNIVVENEEGLAQASPSGQVEYENRSIFTTRPSFTSTEDLQVSSNAIFAAGGVPDNSVVAIDVLQVPNKTSQYTPQDLTLILS